MEATFTRQQLRVQTRDLKRAFSLTATSVLTVNQRSDVPEASFVINLLTTAFLW